MVENDKTTEDAVTSSDEALHAGATKKVESLKDAIAELGFNVKETDQGIVVTLDKEA
jgi:hypothetical protein